jgi:hypothetical protein
MTLHFVPKEGHAADLEERLRGLGFREVRQLTDHVLLRAESEEISERLGVALESSLRERRVGPARTRERVPTLAASARLPAPLDQLVERFYVPVAPDRFD